MTEANAGTAVNRWDVPVGRRLDGEPWKVRFVEVKGSAHGPATAFVAGIYGDEPLSCQIMFALERRLAQMEVRGSVILVPAANPPALALGTRLGPDALQLNRLFPGAAGGALTSQLAYHIFNELKSRTDCAIDFHSGTPTFGCWFVYDHGDLPLTASFGLPIVQNFKREGQLAVAATRAGMKSFLVEIGYGRNAPGDVEAGVEACLNTLRFRGHLEGELTGPKSVPLMPEVSLYVNSIHGAFVGRYGVEDVGRMLEPGVLGGIMNVATGEQMEEFVLKAPGMLVLANATPCMMAPGGFPYFVGHIKGEAERKLPSR
jgi:predicted deacylase